MPYLRSGSAGGRQREVDQRDAIELSKGKARPQGCPRRSCRVGLCARGRLIDAVHTVPSRTHCPISQSTNPASPPPPSLPAVHARGPAPCPWRGLQLPTAGGAATGPYPTYPLPPWALPPPRPPPAAPRPHRRPVAGREPQSEPWPPITTRTLQGAPADMRADARAAFTGGRRAQLAVPQHEHAPHAGCHRWAGRGKGCAPSTLRQQIWGQQAS